VLKSSWFHEYPRLLGHCDYAESYLACETFVADAFLESDAKLIMQCQMQ